MPRGPFVGRLLYGKSGLGREFSGLFFCEGSEAAGSWASQELGAFIELLNSSEQNSWHLSLSVPKCLLRRRLGEWGWVVGWGRGWLAASSPSSGLPRAPRLEGWAVFSFHGLICCPVSPWPSYAPWSASPLCFSDPQLSPEAAPPPTQVRTPECNSPERAKASPGFPPGWDQGRAFGCQMPPEDSLPCALTAGWGPLFSHHVRGTM